LPPWAPPPVIPPAALEQWELVYVALYFGLVAIVVCFHRSCARWHTATGTASMNAALLNHPPADHHLAHPSVARNEPDQRARAHAYAWFLLLLALISLSPATILAVAGAWLTMHRLRTTTTQPSDAGHDVATAAARLWYVPAALAATATCITASTFWIFDATGTLDAGFLRPLVHWLALCSPVLAVGCVWAARQHSPSSKSASSTQPATAH
jgi:hypothetical protein